MRKYYALIILSILLFTFKSPAQFWQKTIGSGDSFYPNAITRVASGTYNLLGTQTSGTVNSIYMTTVDSTGTVLGTTAFQADWLEGIINISPTETLVSTYTGTSSILFKLGAGNSISFVKQGLGGKMAKLGSEVIITNPFAKINPTTGDTVWTRKFDYSSNGATINYVHPLSDGSIGGVGWIYEGMLIARFNSNGDTLWTRHYHQLGTSNHICTQLNGGSILVSLSYMGGGPMLHKFDINGNLLWTNGIAYTGIGLFTAMKLIPTSDGGALIGGTISGSGISGTDMGMVKINSSGTVQWAKAYGGTFNESLADFVVDGNYILMVGQTNSFSSTDVMYVVRADINGYAGCNEVTLPMSSSLTTYNIDAGLNVSRGAIYGSGSISPTTLSISSNTVCNGVGVREYEAGTELSLYPNPALHTITIKGYHGTVSIFNSLSIKVYEGIVDGSVDVSSLPSGLYTICTNNSLEGKSILKFVKQ